MNHGEIDPRPWLPQGTEALYDLGRDRGLCKAAAAVLAMADHAGVGWAPEACAFSVQAVHEFQGEAGSWRAWDAFWAPWWAEYQRTQAG